MTEYLLETDTCIFHLKNKFDIRSKILAVGRTHCYICELTVAELLYGAYNSSNFAYHSEDHLRILEVASILRIKDSFDLFGKEKARLRASGTPIYEFDLLIGVTALHHNMTLVTNNTKHMSRIEGLKLENWTQSQHNEFV